jgi:hypothetical protein
MDMYDDGEPISRGQVDLRALERRALRNAMFGVALFAGVVLVNGILFILLIGLFQALGWWEVAASEGVNNAAGELFGGLRVRAPATAD